MPYKRVKEPVRGEKAFQSLDNDAVLSQAAILACLGRQLRGDDVAHLARSAAAGMEAETRSALAGQAEEFPVPQIGLPGIRHLGTEVQSAVGKRFGKASLKRSRPETLGALAGELYAKPSQTTAAHLLEVCLNHPDELCRVAAAFAYFPISAEADRLLKILVKGTRSTEEIVFHASATALARIAPGHSQLRRLTRPQGRTPETGRTADTTLLIHGTFARNETWWQPGGDFHTYILNDVRSDLYDQNDAFRWSGAWDHSERVRAAEQLRLWLAAHAAQNPQLFGHSHGANVAMLANQAGLQLEELVLLSCPVHPQYSPRFNLVNKPVVSFHVKFDLVILIDGGGQRFTDPRIQENVLAGWFLGHSGTHDPEVWKDQALDQKV